MQVKMPGQGLDGLLTPVAMLFDVLQEAQASERQPQAAQGIRPWRHGFHDTLKAAGQSAQNAGIRSLSHVAALLGPYLRQSQAPDDLERAHGLTALLFSFLSGDLEPGEASEILELVARWVRPLTPLPEAVQRLVGQALIQDCQHLSRSVALPGPHDQEVQGQSTGVKTVALDEMALVAQAWGECAELAGLLHAEWPVGQASITPVPQAARWLDVAERQEQIGDALAIMGLGACARMARALAAQVQVGLTPKPVDPAIIVLDRGRAAALRQLALVWQHAFVTCEPDSFWKAVAALEPFSHADTGLTQAALDDTRIELLALQIIESRQLSLRPEAADDQALSLAWPQDLDQRVQLPLLLELRTLASRFAGQLQSATAVGGEAMQDCLRCAHGIKGAAQGAGIAGLARFAHAIEDVLICLDRDGLASDQRLVASLEEAAAMLQQVVALLPKADPPPEGFAELVRRLDAEVHQRALAQQRPQQRAPASAHAALQSVPAVMPGQDRMTATALASAASPATEGVPDQVGLADALGPWLEQTVSQVARASGKQVDLQLDAPMSVDARLLGELTPALGHLLRNAVDHGIEAPATRMAIGKPVRGRINLSFRLAGGRDGAGAQVLEIRIQDDGAGLDLMRVRERAVALGLVTAHQAALSDDGQVADWIFAPGLSTRSDVSLVSGRGIGMDAVRATISRLNGVISLRTLAGKGTTFLIRMPCRPPRPAQS